MSLGTNLNNQDATNYVTKVMVISRLTKSFRCPELEKQTWDLSSINPVPSTMKTSTVPFTFLLATFGNKNIYSVAKGYNYMAGFDTESWLSLPVGTVAWESPRRMSDAGHLAFVTDNNRYLPYGGAYQPMPSYQLVHTERGIKVVMVAKLDDPARTYRGAATNIGYIDGSVKYQRLSNLSLHQVMATNGRFYQREFNWF